MKISDRERDPDLKANPGIKAKAEVDLIETNIRVDRKIMKNQDPNITQDVVIDQNRL